jgi:hypothetical protein
MINSYYLPATSQLGQFSFSSLPFGQSFVHTSQSFAGLGFQNWAEVSPEVGNPQELLKAKDTAVKEGNKWWEKALSAVLVYGTPILEALAKAGIIKNKNSINEVVNGQLDYAKLQALYNSGGLTTATTRETEIFGLKTSQLLLLGAGLLGYWIISKK